MEGRGREGGMVGGWERIRRDGGAEGLALISGNEGNRQRKNGGNG